MLMRVLLIKTSSMGDIIHTLPALTDAGLALPGITFDWVVEDTFSEIPSWHPLVDKVIPVALRRWRKGLLARETRLGWKTLRQQLHANHYDLILDAQGLVKSAFLTFFAKGLRVGLDWGSAREALASLAYQRQCKVDFYQHAIVRMRSLFSQALGYSLPDTEADFGLTTQLFQPLDSLQPYVVFLHGTTWTTKQWPEDYWIQLAEKVGQAGYRIKISGGNAEEVERAERLASHSEMTRATVDVLPYLTISHMAALLANAKAAVAVDTGFGHLAAALNIPTVSLYGATNPAYTSACGKASVHLVADFPCAPCLRRTCTFKGSSTVTPACYATLTPTHVWQTLTRVMPH
jgi:heptosyltransferase I